MKFTLYWTYATRSLTRGGQRSLLAIFCVAVGVLAIVSLQLVSNAISSGLTGNVRALNGGDLSISNTTAPLSAQQLSYFDQLQSQGEITGYTAIASTSGGFRTTSGATHFFQINAVDPARFPLEGAPTFTQPANGRLSSVLQGNTVVITTALSQTLNVKQGDTEQLYTQDGRLTNVTIGGIIQDTGLFRGSMLLINLATYTAIPSSTAQPVTYNVMYADVPGHSDANAMSVEKVIQGHFPLATIQTTQQALAGNSSQVQQIQYFLQIVGLLALLIGGVGIVNTMQVLLRRRRIEIAMLKTAGYRRGDLYALFGVEAGLIGLVGGVVGTLAGVGVSYVVKGLMESSLQITLSNTVDARTLGAGVAVGFLTALIFGLLPIVQASQVRPQAVLRELPESVGWRGNLAKGLLFALLVVLFFALSLGILQNVSVAALAVGGTGLFLMLLSLFFGVVVLIISKIPVVESFRWWYAPLLLLPLLVALALTSAIPAFGVLCLVVTLLGIGVMLLPRPWKANVKLALRNIGRQKARTVATLLALYIGVFSVGLILVLGQNIKDTLNSFLASGNGTNAQIVASSADRSAVEHQLALVKGVRHEVEASFTQAAPVAVNGQPIGQFVRTATAGSAYTANDVAGVMNGAQGYDLAHGITPSTSNTPITSGRNLTANDAGTLNALLPMAASQAPDNLTSGDTITVMSQADKTPITLTIVGFYSTRLPQFGPILVDSAIVKTLSAGQPQYGFAMHLDPSTTDATLAQIQKAVPTAFTYSLSDFVDQYVALLNSLITVLVAVTSLAMLASVIIIANAVALAMLERRRELGILKAVGHTSRSVLGEVLMENAVIGFTGAFLALLVVVAAATALGKFAFNLPITVPTLTVLGVVAATAVLCMGVAATVAWGATRVRPVEVLRYE